MPPVNYHRMHFSAGLSWCCESNKRYNSELYYKSRELLGRLLPAKIFNDDYLVHDIQVKRQVKNIYFYAVINDSIVLLFEDKIRSRMHNDQLRKYHDKIIKLFPEHEIFKYYLKSDIVWPHEVKAVVANGYQLIDIYQVSRMLEPGTDNDIYEDFVSNINYRLNLYESYKTKPVNKWNNYQWLGFLYHLILVFSWHDNVFRDNCHLSLEMHTGRLLIKAHVFDKNINRRKHRDDIIPVVTRAFDHYDCTVYNRTGKSMTLLEFHDFMVLRDDSLLDYDRTVERLNEIIGLFDGVVEGAF